MKLTWDNVYIEYLKMKPQGARVILKKFYLNKGKNKSNF